MSIIRNEGYRKIIDSDYDIPAAKRLGYVPTSSNTVLYVGTGETDSLRERVNQYHRKITGKR